MTYTGCRAGIVGISRGYDGPVWGLSGHRRIRWGQWMSPWLVGVPILAVYRGAKQSAYLCAQSSTSRKINPTNRGIPRGVMYTWSRRKSQGLGFPSGTGYDICVTGRVVHGRGHLTTKSPSGGAKGADAGFPNPDDAGVFLRNRTGPGLVIARDRVCDWGRRASRSGSVGLVGATVGGGTITAAAFVRMGGMDRVVTSEPSEDGTKR
jgi:hypothetical protein